MTQRMDPSRRRFMGRAAMAMLGGFGVGPVLGCGGSSPTSASSVTAGTTNSEVPDDRFVRIPANPSFVFGAGVGSAAADASPIQVDYCMSRFLVTNADYLAFAASSGVGVPRYWTNGLYPSGKHDHPVLWVSYDNAKAYCDWLATQLSGWTVRVPTEAEWENAARGPAAATYPWGNSQGTSYTGGVLTANFTYNGVCAAFYLATQAESMATYNHPSSSLYGTRVPIASILSIGGSGGVSGWIDHDQYAGFVYTDVYDALIQTGGHTTPVGAYETGVSGYGCYDMAGNAFEWTSSLITAQNGEETGQTVNAVRGGSWYSTGSSCRSTYRGEGRSPSGGYHSVGFRIVAVEG